MGEEDVTVLRQQLADALVREQTLRAEMQDVSKVRARRQQLGNPFFYSGGRYDRPENAATSVHRYSGYASHEAGLASLRELQRVRRTIAAIQEELRRRGTA